MDNTNGDAQYMVNSYRRAVEWNEHLKLKSIDGYGFGTGLLVEQVRFSDGDQTDVIITVWLTEETMVDMTVDANTSVAWERRS